jgi:aspartyl-tRNA(Asn)/glutamyl-tRNA(Gln) amidotransferase subunit A
MTGGSTSGPAAATAGGLAHAGIGTDTSGSLRTPASLCGLVSIRPTPGLVPTDGVVPLAPSYDTVGPIARTVADARLLLEVIAGVDPGALDASPGDGLQGTRIGVAEQFLGEGCADFIAGAVRAAAELMESAGAAVRSVELPGLADAGEMHRTIQFFEAAASHRPWFDDQRPRYAPDVLERLEMGAALSDDEYEAALRARERVREETARVTADLDVVLAPATPVTAPPLGTDDVEIDGDRAPLRPALLSLTLPFTQPGGPVVAVPLGEEGGLPFGLQLLGRPGRDGAVLEIAAAYRRLAGQDEPG